MLKNKEMITMNGFLSIIASDKFKGAVAIIAAVIMYFTPDHIDRIIETLLGAFGVSALFLTEKKQ